MEQEVDKEKIRDNTAESEKRGRSAFSRALSYLSTILIIFLLLVGGGIILSYVDNPWGIKVFSVLSNSMSPSIHRGSLIFTLSQEGYEVGDIITYKPASGRLGGVEVDSVTHRIESISELEGIKMFTTKGDANPGPDVERVSESNIIGKVLFELPLIGYPIEFAKTEIGLLFLVIIPAVVITYEEIRKLLKGVDLRKVRLKVD